MWALSTIIGKERRLANEHKRASHRDRGRDKNALVDLMGCMGEVISLKHFKKDMTLSNYNAFKKDIFTFEFIKKYIKNVDANKKLLEK